MSELLKINVNDHTESKNGLTYLAWAWAWATVLQHDPEAQWEVWEYKAPDGAVLPCMFLPDGSAMVKVAVTIKGKTRSCMLPVMNHKNQAIKGPDAFQINTALQRCGVKAIAMHGLGLYIYAGEDLPPMDTEALDQLLTDIVEAHKEGKTLDAVSLWYGSETIRLSNEAREYCWGQLREWSAIRSAIKANRPETTAPEKQAA
jgi:hypothetical protein